MLSVFMLPSCGPPPTAAPTPSPSPILSASPSPAPTVAITDTPIPSPSPSATSTPPAEPTDEPSGRDEFHACLDEYFNRPFFEGSIELNKVHNLAETARAMVREKCIFVDSLTGTPIDTLKKCTNGGGTNCVGTMGTLLSQDPLPGNGKATCDSSGSILVRSDTGGNENIEEEELIIGDLVSCSVPIENAGHVAMIIGCGKLDEDLVFEADSYIDLSANFIETKNCNNNDPNNLIIFHNIGGINHNGKYIQVGFSRLSDMLELQCPDSENCENPCKFCRHQKCQDRVDSYLNKENLCEQYNEFDICLDEHFLQPDFDATLDDSTFDDPFIKERTFPHNLYETAYVLTVKQCKADPASTILWDSMVQCEDGKPVSCSGLIRTMLGSKEVAPYDETYDSGFGDGENICFKPNHPTFYLEDETDDPIPFSIPFQTENPETYRSIMIGDVISCTVNRLPSGKALINGHTGMIIGYGSLEGKTISPTIGGKGIMDKIIKEDYPPLVTAPDLSKIIVFHSAKDRVGYSTLTDFLNYYGNEDAGNSCTICRPLKCQKALERYQDKCPAEKEESRDLNSIRRY